MSSGNKLTRAFRKVAGHGAVMALSVPLSITAGIYTVNHVDHPYAVKAPVENAVQHAAAVAKVQEMGAEFIAENAKIEFKQGTLDRAARNGADPASLKDGYAAVERDRQAEKTHLAAYRQELLLNPALSENEAGDLYNNLYMVGDEKADKVLRDELPNTSGILAYRDEVKASLGLPADPAKVTPEMTAHLLDKAGILAAANLKQDKDDFLEVGGGLFSALFGFGMFARRKNKREEEEKRAQYYAERKKLSAPPRRHDPPAEAPAAPKKPEHKFSL